MSPTQERMTDIRNNPIRGSLRTQVCFVHPVVKAFSPPAPDTPPETTAHPADATAEPAPARSAEYEKSPADIPPQTTPAAPRSSTEEDRTCASALAGKKSAKCALPAD